MYLARSGYIWVIQDVRGKYMSEGDFVDVRPFNPAASKAGEQPQNHKAAVDERRTPTTRRI